MYKREVVLVFSHFVNKMLIVGGILLAWMFVSLGTTGLLLMWGIDTPFFWADGAIRIWLLTIPIALLYELQQDWKRHRVQTNPFKFTLIIGGILIVVLLICGVILLIVWGLTAGVLIGLGFLPNAGLLWMIDCMLGLFLCKLFLRVV